LIAASQSLTEIANSPQRDLLLENFSGKIFLPNYAASGEFVRDLYRRIGLDDNQIACIASARPRAEYLYTCAYGTRKFRLELGEISRAICASTSHQDVTAARRILGESPAGLFLDNWLNERRVSAWESFLPVPTETEAVAGR